MKKSYNEIRAQEQRVLQQCRNSGRYCDNAKRQLDMQRIAQITRSTLSQHGFPIFGNFDKDERRPCIFRENTSLELTKAEEPERMKVQKQTPTEQAHERIAFNDWMSADEENRKKIQDACRHAFVKKMYAELLTDMEICKLEGWDVLEFPRMLKQALQVCFPKEPIQLTLF